MPKTGRRRDVEFTTRTLPIDLATFAESFSKPFLRLRSIAAHSDSWLAHSEPWPVRSRPCPPPFRPRTSYFDVARHSARSRPLCLTIAAIHTGPPGRRDSNEIERELSWSCCHPKQVSDCLLNRPRCWCYPHPGPSPTYRNTGRPWPSTDQPFEHIVPQYCTLVHHGCAREQNLDRASFVLVCTCVVHPAPPVPARPLYRDVPLNKKSTHCSSRPQAPGYILTSLRRTFVYMPLPTLPQQRPRKNHA
jgi:hypothetical protein